MRQGDDRILVQVPGLQNPAALKALLDGEPGAYRDAVLLNAAGALMSPSSGIVDSHGLMTALLADAENAGATLALAEELASVGSWLNLDPQRQVAVRVVLSVIDNRHRCIWPHHPQC